MPVNNAPTSEVNANRVPLPDARTVALRDYCVTLPDDPQYLALLLGAIGRLAQQQTYQRDATQMGAKQVAAVWRDVYDAIARGGFVPCADGSGGGDGGVTLMITDDSEEDDMKPCYQKFGDVWYVGLPCGDCGGLEWVPLGTGGGPPGSPGGGGSVVPGANGGGYPNNVPALPGSARDCYEQKAADVYIKQISDWAGNIIDLISSGLDFFPDPGDAVDFAAQAIDAVTSGDNYTSLEGVSKQQVTSTLETYQQALADAWPDAGEVTRAQLYRLNSDVLPNLDNAVPVRKIADWFSSFGNIRALNARLAIAQSECASGTTGALPPPTPSGVVITEVNSSYYEVSITSEFVGVAGSSTGWRWLLGHPFHVSSGPNEKEGLVGVAMDWDKTNTGLVRLWTTSSDVDDYAYIFGDEYDVPNNPTGSIRTLQNPAGPDWSRDNYPTGLPQISDSFADESVGLQRGQRILARSGPPQPFILTLHLLIDANLIPKADYLANAVQPTLDGPFG